MSEESTASNSSIDMSGKYLTFKLFDEFYGINVEVIQQIIAIPVITPIPKTPDFVKGVINLRGKIIPVIDLRQRFSLEQKEYDSRTSIIIIRFYEMEKEFFIGVIVDTVLEVMDINNKDIEEKPSFGLKMESEFILGMAKIKDNVTTLLDIRNVLTKDEMNSLTETLS